MHDDTSNKDRLWLRATANTHAAPLLRYARSITNDSERAKDAVQETFLRLCKSKRKQVEDKIPPWLYRVCRTRIIDIARKENVMITLDESGSSRIPSEAPRPDQASETKDAASQALELLKGLPGKQREVVRLKFQNGMSYKEIAEVTELSVSHVGVLLHSALNTLRSEMKA